MKPSQSGSVPLDNLRRRAGEDPNNDEPAVRRRLSRKHRLYFLFPKSSFDLLPGLAWVAPQRGSKCINLREEYSATGENWAEQGHERRQGDCEESSTRTRISCYQEKGRSG